MRPTEDIIKDLRDEACAIPDSGILREAADRLAFYLKIVGAVSPGESFNHIKDRLYHGRGR